MSKNHPHDNIYSILGKLEALQPTPQEKHDAKVQMIRESVESQGSILKGLRNIDPIEARLQTMFERDEGKPGKNFAKISKDAAKRYGSQEAGNRVAGAVRAKLAKAGKLEETNVEECAMCEAGTCTEHNMEESYTVTKGPDRYGRSYYNEPDFTGEEPPKRVINKGVRGRPKKADSERSAASLPQFGKKFNDPFGRVPGTPPKGKKGTVHTMGENLDTLSTKLNRIVEGVNLQALLKEKHQTVEEMLSELSNDIKVFKETGHCSELLRDCMEIKAAHGKMIADEAAAPMAQPSVQPGSVVYWRGKAGKVDRCEGNKCFVHLGNGEMDVWPAQEVSNQKQSMLDVFKKDASEIGQGLKGFFTGGQEPTNTMEDAELNELARLAGLTVSENVDKDKFAALAEPKDKITYADKIAGAKMNNEADMEEGNKFTAGLRDDDVEIGDTIPGTNAVKKVDIDETGMEECGAGMQPSADNINISTNMSSNGDKNVTVTANGAQAEALMQMLKLAGIGGQEGGQEVVVAEPAEQIADEGIEVDDAGADPVNAPEEQYFSMKGSTMGPGEGDPGEKAMHPDRPTFKNGDNPLSKPANESVPTLEARLAAEYESIKKVTK